MSAGRANLRVLADSHGLDPASLVAGRDVVLAMNPAHGLDLPAGVAVHDHLDIDARWAIYRAAAGAIADVRELLDEPLTVDGVCLPWIWEAEILVALTILFAEAEGLLRCVRNHDPASLRLTSTLPRHRRVASVVAAAAGIELREQPAGVAPAGSRAGPRRPSAGGARHELVRWARAAGLPSHLRPGCDLLVSYWPLMALLDRMLADRRRRPAVALQRPPTGPGRSLRAAQRGGWLGAPGPADRRRARAVAEPALQQASTARRAPIAPFGVDLCEPVLEEVLGIARRRAAFDLATAAMLRRVLRRSAPASVIVPFDTQPDGRLLVSLAREAGVRTLGLPHGAYLLPQLLGDLELCDEVLLWSEQVAPRMSGGERPVHVVGYPLPHAPPPPTRARGGGAPATVLVLGQPSPTSFALCDPRTTMRHYAVALGALRQLAPAPRIVLRPHPAEGSDAALAAAASFAGSEIAIDASTPIQDLYRACSLCLGTATTATLQAVLNGTPVVALNLTGFEWSWPLGGDTTVPVARSAGELSACLDRWASGRPLPGREALLTALGLSEAGGDGTSRILAILDEGATACGRSSASSRTPASRS